MSVSHGAPLTERVPRRRLDARVRNYRDALLVAGPQQAFELSDTAAFVFKAIDGERSIADIAGSLASEYDVDYDTALTDVGELLDALSAAEIVTFGAEG